MAKLSLSLDERSKRNGMQLIRLKITNKGSNAFAGTGVYVEPEYFAKYSLYDPIRGRAYMAAEKREQVRLFVKKFEDVMAGMEPSELDQMMASEIKALALGKSKKPADAPQTDSNKDFLAWYSEYTETRQTEKTRESYRYGLQVLREYCASLHLRTLLFQDIDYARLSDFARWLTATKRGPSTRHMIESYVRAAYKEAQRRHLVSRENDPYFDYSIKPVPLRKIEYLTADELRTLMDAELPTTGMQRARDIVLMSFYLCGANLLDLYDMKPPKRGVARFVRHKIENKYQCDVEIHVEPELKALIDRYKGDGQMLCFKTTYPNYESFRHKIAHRLREVSKVVGFDVSMSKVRRSWATIAGRLRIEELVIDMSMGHIVRSINVNHYEEYDWSRTAEANRQIIDYVQKS